MTRELGSDTSGLWPQVKFLFEVDFGDGAHTAFCKVSMIEAPPRRPGAPAGRGAHALLERGVIPPASGFWDWWAATQAGRIDKRTVQVRLLDEKGVATMSWTLTDAWPTRVVSTPTTGVDTAIEVIELAVGAMTLGAPAT